MFSGENIALGEPTLQSATLWSYEPGLGKDLTNIFHKFSFFFQWEEIVTDYVKGTICVISSDPQCKDGNWIAKRCWSLNWMYGIKGGRVGMIPFWIKEFLPQTKLFPTLFFCNPMS